MRKSFSFVFMGALGFTAAVGASSFSSSTILNFQNTGIGEVVDGIGSDGFKFSGGGASFVETGGGNIAVAIKKTTKPFEILNSLDEFGAGTGSVALISPSLDNSPFFSIEPTAFDTFEFISAKLDNVFKLTEQGFIVSAFGQTAASEFFKSVIPSKLKSGTLNAGDIGLAGKPLTKFGLSLGSGSGGIPTTLSEEPFEIAELLIDDVEVVSAVPVPASALLLGSALLGAGAFARRKKRT